jgi:predicted CXXCH cytochrome family protein
MKPTSVWGPLVLRICTAKRSRGRLFRHALTLAAAFTVALVVPALAFAFHTDGRETRNGALVACEDCHVTWSGGSDDGSSTVVGAGPHGYYRADTEKCRMCHTIHKAPANSMLLLPAATIEAACFTCHDNTGAAGVYSAIANRGLTVVASHSIDATKGVPGGSSDLTTNLTCTSCHSVHRATTVAPFRTDRRLALTTPGNPGARYSNALLRDDVGGKPRNTYTVYGADWCAACHDQRHSDSEVVNHPVESSSTPNFFHYGRVASVEDSKSTSTWILNDLSDPGTGLGMTNYGYVMPYPRTLDQYPGPLPADNHKPICQQCHEDARNVGVPGDAVGMYPGDFDASSNTTNPVVYSFPHQSTNVHMQVEEHDDLCFNCHTAAQLP